jgi:tetratricopeptide (TPR) repeat protein
MLETLRDYAREKLEQSAEAPEIAVRHCDHYFAFAKEARDGLMQPDTADWVRRAEADLDNIRAAIALALSGGTDPVLAVKFAVTMMPFWQLRGHASEGRGIVRTALALPAVQASDLAMAHAYYAGASLAEIQADHAEMRHMLEASLTLHRKLGNDVDVAATLSTLSLARLKAGDPLGAEDSEREALTMFEAIGDSAGQAIGLLHLGQIASYIGDTASAQTNLEQCLRLAQAIDHHEVEGEAELRLAENAFGSGRLDDARRHAERSLAICCEAGDRRGEARAVQWLGKLDLATGDVDRAQQRLGSAVQTFRDFGMSEELVGCLEDHVELATRCGNAMQAAKLLGAAQSFRQRLDLAPSKSAVQRREHLLDCLRDQLQPDAFEAACQSGAAMDLNAAYHEARVRT